MTTLQEYLNQKYPTKEDREKVKEIDVYKINKVEGSCAFDKILDGGKLDLSEYTRLEIIMIYGTE
ncbi:5533_t:CDS:1, partial [Scutellospora calospora]